MLCENCSQGDIVQKKILFCLQGKVKHDTKTVMNEGSFTFILFSLFIGITANVQQLHR